MSHLIERSIDVQFTLGDSSTGRRCYLGHESNSWNEMIEVKEPRRDEWGASKKKDQLFPAERATFHEFRV